MAPLDPARNGESALSGPRHSASLCTGIGGLDLAVEQHFGTRMAWLSEIEPSVLPVIERAWPDTPNLGDLKDIDWAAAPPVDILTAGYPCQPFSAAGKRKGTDDPRHLWPYIAEGVRRLRPRLVVLENVQGHLTKGFDVVLGDLAEAGFDAEWCLVRAADVGACHRRARVFIVAAHPDRGGWDWWRSSEPAVPWDGNEARLGGPAGAGPHAADSNGFDVDGRGQAGPRGRDEPAAGREVASDADGGRLQERPQQHGEASQTAADGHPRGGHPDGLGDPARWGEYATAIARHELTFGRPAPDPCDEKDRLAVPFVEWMQGYPEGWVDGLGRTAALKALGNSVITRQALAALRELCPVEATRTGAAACA